MTMEWHDNSSQWSSDSNVTRMDADSMLDMLGVHSHENHVFATLPDESVDEFIIRYLSMVQNSEIVLLEQMRAQGEAAPMVGSDEFDDAVGLIVQMHIDQTRTEQGARTVRADTSSACNSVRHGLPLRPQCEEPNDIAMQHQDSCESHLNIRHVGDEPTHARTHPRHDDPLDVPPSSTTMTPTIRASIVSHDQRVRHAPRHHDYMAPDSGMVHSDPNHQGEDAIAFDALDLADTVYDTLRRDHDMHRGILVAHLKTKNTFRNERAFMAASGSQLVRSRTTLYADAERSSLSSSQPLSYRAQCPVLQHAQSSSQISARSHDVRTNSNRTRRSNSAVLRGSDIRRRHMRVQPYATPTDYDDDVRETHAVMSSIAPQLSQAYASHVTRTIMDSAVTQPHVAGQPQPLAAGIVPTPTVTSASLSDHTLTQWYHLMHQTTRSNTVDAPRPSQGMEGIVWYGSDHVSNDGVPATMPCAENAPEHTYANTQRSIMGQFQKTERDAAHTAVPMSAVTKSGKGRIAKRTAATPTTAPFTDKERASLEYKVSSLVSTSDLSHRIYATLGDTAWSNRGQDHLSSWPSTTDLRHYIDHASFQSNFCATCCVALRVGADSDVMVCPQCHYFARVPENTVDKATYGDDAMISAPVKTVVSNDKAKTPHTRECDRMMNLLDCAMWQRTVVGNRRTETTRTRTVTPSAKKSLMVPRAPSVHAGTLEVSAPRPTRGRPRMIRNALPGESAHGTTSGHDKAHAVVRPPTRATTPTKSANPPKPVKLEHGVLSSPSALVPQVANTCGMFVSRIQATMYFEKSIDEATGFCRHVKNLKCDYEVEDEYIKLILITLVAQHGLANPTQQLIDKAHDMSSLKTDCTELTTNNVHHNRRDIQYRHVCDAIAGIPLPKLAVYAPQIWSRITGNALPHIDNISRTHHATLRALFMKLEPNYRAARQTVALWLEQYGKGALHHVSDIQIAERNALMARGNVTWESMCAYSDVLMQRTCFINYAPILAIAVESIGAHEIAVMIPCVTQCHEAQIYEYWIWQRICERLQLEMRPIDLAALFSWQPHHH